MEYTTLNNGVKMPMAGIGTFLLSPDEAESSVLHALQDGYRLIDTANAYLNEKAVGRAMKLSGVPRREIFLEAKLWPSFYAQPDAVDKTLARLGKKYGKSAAQIILRWHIQCGTIVIPGSKNPEHIRSNFALFNFALTESEMAEIAALDKNQLYYIRTPELLKKYAEMIPPVQFGLIAEQILSGADGDIHYSYYLPESYDGSREYPLMVVMPGYDMMWFGESSSGRNINWSGFTAWTKLDTERCGGVYLHGRGRRVLRQREGALRLRNPARSLRSCGLERCGHFDFLLPFDVPHGRYLREKAASSTPSHAARLSGVGSRSARS